MVSCMTARHLAMSMKRCGNPMTSMRSGRCREQGCEVIALMPYRLVSGYCSLLTALDRRARKVRWQEVSPAVHRFPSDHPAITA